MTRWGHARSPGRRGVPGPRRWGGMGCMVPMWRGFPYRGAVAAGADDRSGERRAPEGVGEGHGPGTWELDDPRPAAGARRDRRRRVGSRSTAWWSRTPAWSIGGRWPTLPCSRWPVTTPGRWVAGSASSRAPRPSTAAWWSIPTGSSPTSCPRARRSPQPHREGRARPPARRRPPTAWSRPCGPSTGSTPARRSASGRPSGPRAGPTPGPVVAGCWPASWGPSPP